MTDQRDTPDTRTPSAEPLTLTPFGKVVAALLRSELNGYDREATADEVLAALSAPGQGSDAPSAPNRAPTDVLVERLRRAGRACGPYYADKIQVGPALLDAADALEDLTRENERLRARIDVLCQDYDTATLNALHEQLKARDEQVAAVRALCDEWGQYDQTVWQNVAFTRDRLLGALDTASEDRRPGEDAAALQESEFAAGLFAAADRRPEDGYGTDNVPGGWGGPGSQETRDA